MLKKTSCVRLCGGLGNQMFQFAFGCALESSGHQVWFDTVNGFLHDPFRRTYALEQFPIDTRKAEGGQLPWGVAWRPPIHLAVKAFWKALPRNLRRVYYEKSPFAYESEALGLSNSASYFWGYWQNPAYVQPVADTLRRQFRLRTGTSAFAQLWREITDRRSLSIHVRRYRDLDKHGRVIVSAQDAHGVCDASYYQQAARAIPDHTHQHAYVFSDDPAWAKRNLGLSIQCSYVADRGSFTAAEELMLMAACKNHVISNSSFSWWGAWLGGNTAKTVVAPKSWNKRLGGDQSTVCPASWIRL